MILIFGKGDEGLGCRRRESTLDGPAAMKTRTGANVIDVQAFTPGHERKSFAVMGYQAIVATVATLFGASAPATVLWTVCAVIIDPVQGMLGAWPLTHIRKKGCERIQPVLANRDAAATVVGEVRTVFVETALAHGPVTHVSNGSPMPVGPPMPVFCQKTPHLFSMKAAAAATRSIEEVLAADDFLNATLTKAKPISTPALSADKAHDIEAAKATGFEMDDAWIHDSFPFEAGGTASRQEGNANLSG